MAPGEVEFAVCSITGPSSLWTVRWSSVTAEFQAFPSTVTADRAFTLASHPEAGLLYLASLTEAGELLALSRAGTAESPDFSVAERIALAGVERPCRVRLDEEASWLGVAGYSSGTLTMLALDTSGAIVGEPDTQAFAGSGSDPERQDRSYLHDVAFGPDSIFAADLGADLIRVVDATSLHERSTIACPAGSGPRHIAYAGDGLLVVSGELDSTLMLFQEEDGNYRLIDAVPASSVPTQTRNYPSAVVADPMSGIVHLANRGADTILTASVVGGRLTVLAETPSGAASPDHLLLHGNYLFAVHSTDGVLTSLKLASGIPSGESGGRATIPGAIWIEHLPIH